jgi:hypothetical protein
MVLADTATWVAAGAAVLASVGTFALACVAVAQIRSSRHMLEALVEHVEAAQTQASATAQLAQLAQNDQIDRLMGTHSAVFASSDVQLAAAVTGIAQTLARAFPASADAPASDAERARGSVRGSNLSESEQTSEDTSAANTGV